MKLRVPHYTEQQSNKKQAKIMASRGDSRVRKALNDQLHKFKIEKVNFVDFSESDSSGESQDQGKDSQVLHISKVYSEMAKEDPCLDFYTAGRYLGLELVGQQVNSILELKNKLKTLEELKDFVLESLETYSIYKVVNP